MAAAGRQSSPHPGGAEPRGGSSPSGRRQASVRRAPPIRAATHRPRLGAPRPAPPPGWRPPRVHPTIVRAHSPATPDGQASEQRVEESSQGIPHATGSASRARTVSQRQRTGTSRPSSILVLSSKARSTQSPTEPTRRSRIEFIASTSGCVSRTSSVAPLGVAVIAASSHSALPGNRNRDLLVAPIEMTISSCHRSHVQAFATPARHSSRARDMHVVFATPPAHVQDSRQTQSCDRQQHALARGLR